MLDDAVGNAFARKDLVLAVADQDGGAHVDATLEAAYGALTRANSMGLGQAAPDEPNAAGLSFAMEGLTRVPDPDARPPDNSIALASVRQIAYELTTSLSASVADDGTGITLRNEICPIPIADAPADVGRNDPCPCGSGRKFKHCFRRREPRREEYFPPG